MPVYSNPWRPGVGYSFNLLPLPCEQMSHLGSANGTRSYTIRADVEKLTISSVVGYWTGGGDGGSKGDVVKINSNLMPINYTSTHYRLTQTVSFSGYMWGGALQKAPKPQQPRPIRIPLTSITELKDLMQNRLDYGDCNEAVAKLIAQLSKDGAAKGNVATDGDVMTVFNRIANAGGIRINVATSEQPPPRFQGDKPVAGGLGLSWREYKRLPNNVDFLITEKMWIRTMPAGYENGPRWNVERVPYEYGITGIHEMLHHIGKNMYTEEDLDKAARALGGGSVDSYLRAHCSPPQYR